MKVFLTGAACALALGVAVAAVGAPPASAQDSVELSMEEFEVLIDDAMGRTNPQAYDDALTGLLERDDLSSFMRGRILFERATRRWQDGMDKFGAVSDFEALLAMDPNHPFANNARIELGYAQTEIGYIEDDMDGLQTLSEWFEGAFALGLHDEAVARYRKAGISPPAEQVELMMAFGYLCEDVPGAPKLHQFGPERPDLARLHWCGAAADMPGPAFKAQPTPVSASQVQTADASDGKNTPANEAETEPAIAVAGP